MIKATVNLSLVLFCFILFGCAGMKPIPESDRNIERIVEVPGFSKDQIYSASKIWIAENFRSAKAVMEYDNKEEGVLIGNGLMPYPCSGLSCMAKADWKIAFTMRNDIKDQKFRLTFSNIRLVWPDAPGRPAYDGPPNQRGMGPIKPVLLRIGDEIVASMNKNKSKSDW